MVASRSTVLDSPSSVSDSTRSAALSAHVHSALMPDTARPAASGPKDLPTHLDFSQDIYGSAGQKQSIQQQILSTPPSKVDFTTPAQDKKSGTQPQYYLNTEGKLVANPKATPSKDGSVKIEVEGNNSAKQAKQYADQMQKTAIQALIQAYKQSHPGEKVPEMWQSIVDAAPNNDFPNTGDGQNNNSVTPEQQTASENNQPFDATPPPESSAPNNDQFNQSYNPGDGSGGYSGSNGGGGGGSASSDLPSAVTGDGGASTGNLTQSSGSIANYDGNQSDMSSTQQGIMSEANKDVGQAMWGGWSKDGATGVEGCAASVSQVLDNAGAANLHNAQDDNVNGMQADLQAQGWTVTDKPQPGDVWVGRGGASSGHTGIVGENNTLLNNNSSDGKFSSDPLSMTSEWTNSVYLKPPASKAA